MRVVHDFQGIPKVGQKFKTVDRLGDGSVKTWEVDSVIGVVGDKFEVEAKIIKKIKK